MATRSPIATWHDVVSALAAVAIPCALLLSGCRSTRETPPDFTLRIGESGGFTGWTTGYQLDPNGDVSRFQIRTQNETTDRLGQLPLPDRQAIWTLLTKSDALKTGGQGTGNLTRFLELTTTEGRQRISWEVSPATDSTPQARLYAECLRRLKGLEENEQE